MNKRYLSLGLAGVLAVLGQATCDAATPLVTDQAEWELSGKLKGRAHLICRDPAPAPAEQVEQELPSPIGISNWTAKAQFSPDGTFRYWEVDTRLKDQPLDKWASYKGTWTQSGDKVVLALDEKSAKGLIGTLDGGAKCGGNAPCYDKKRYKLSGRIRESSAHGARLVLKESVLFGVRSIRAPQQFKCRGQWQFTKAYRSD